MSITVTDQMGRTVKVPTKIERIAALHHFGGKVVFALGQSEKLVDQALYHKENQAMARVNHGFASKPVILKGHGVSGFYRLCSGLSELGPFCVGSRHNRHLCVRRIAGVRFDRDVCGRSL